MRCDIVTVPKRKLIQMDFSKPHGKYLMRYIPMGYFEKDIHIPVLKTDSVVWMSPSVSEINSMNNGVSSGTGNCLTFGLGLGFIVYLWLLKKDVKSVTIVEKNPEIIDLFKKFIQPQFKIDKPIHIIEGDVFDYYNEEFLSKFDYTYVDIWESNDDGLKHYIRLCETNIFRDNIDYWIEDTILHDIQNILFVLLEIYFRKNSSVSEFISGLDDEDLKIVAKKANRYIKSLNITISNEQGLLDLINNKSNLRKILGQ